MSAKFIKRFRLIGLGVALILAIILKEKILLIAGVYWGLIILLTITLKFINPDEYAKLKPKREEENQDEEDTPLEYSDESEDDEGGLRDSYLEGKYSFAILAGTFLLVLIGGIIFLICTGIDYDENQIYIANQNFFNTQIGDLILFQLVPLVIVGVLTGAGCVSIYEILTGVVTPEEKELYSVSLWKSLLNTIVPFVIVFAMLFTIQNWGTVVTEDEIEVYRPGKETVYQWEDMISFSFDEGDAFHSPKADVKFENGVEMHLDFRYFEIQSRQLYKTFGRVWEDGKLVMSEKDLFLKLIFSEKYGHLNEVDLQE